MSAEFLSFMKQPTATAVLLAGVVVALAANAQETTPVEPPKTQVPFKVTFSETFANDYLAWTGDRIGDGPVQQPYCAVSWGHWTVDGWLSHDLKNNEVHHVDTSIGYSTKAKPFLGGQVSATVAARYWNYPSGLFDKDDYLFDLSGSYQGPVRVTLVFRGLLPNGDHDGGLLTWLSISSKPLKVASVKGWDVTCAPDFAVAHLTQFFQHETAFAHIKPGFSISARKGALELMLWGGYQFGLDGQKPSQAHFGLQAALRF